MTKLADHLIGSVTYLCAAAGGEPGAGPATSPLETRVATAAQATLEAWHVRGLDGTVVAAVSASGPSYRLDADRFADVAAVVKTADEISARIGYLHDVPYLWN